MTKLIIILAAIFLVQICNAQTIDYFGQTPPGNTAVVFAPGIISLSNRKEHRIVFTPDGTECYFVVSRDSSKIYYSKYENAVWTKQKEAPFSIKRKINYPFLSSDGNKLYFNLLTTDWKKSDICYVERTAGGWGEPQLLSSPINSDFYDGEYTETTDGSVYLCSNRSGTWDIWCKHPLADNAYSLRDILNFTYDLSQPCIAKDGSYIIFSSYGSSTKYQQLYISFNKGNNEWATPLTMEKSGAKINLANYSQVSPSLSPDGKYLFFSRHNEAGEPFDIYWVSTSVIDTLKKIAMPAASIKNAIKQSIRLYPNPSTGQFTLIFGTAPLKHANAEIYNTEGKRILTKAIREATNTVIDLTGYAKGFYLVKVVTDGVSYENKIFKN